MLNSRSIQRWARAGGITLPPILSRIYAVLVLLRPWRWLVAALVILVWARILSGIPAGLAQVGLFRFIASDFAMYFAQSLALRAGDPAGIYDLDALNRQLQTLVPFAGDMAQPLRVAPVPYPPLFAWLVTPLTFLPPPIAFAVWTAVNLLGAISLGLRCAAICAPRDRAWVFLLLLTSLPVGLNLLGGQPMLLQACAVAEAYFAFRAGRDFRGGAWLSALLFKPQYLLLIGPLLVWKRRWKAVAGLACGAGVVLAGSIVAAGWPAVLAYPRSLLDVSDLRNGLLYTDQMVSWRAVVLVLFPYISDRSGLLLTGLLSIGTILVVLPAWRGRWSQPDALFPHRVTALLIATVLANYHSYPYGLVLLFLPLAAVLGERRTNRVTRFVLYALLAGPLLLPNASNFLFGRVIGVAPMFQILLVAGLACMLAEMVLRPKAPAVTGAA